MNRKPRPAGMDEIVGHEGCIAQWRADADEIIRLTTALQLIASHAGETLIGDGRYDENADHHRDGSDAMRIISVASNEHGWIGADAARMAVKLLEAAGYRIIKVRS